MQQMSYVGKKMKTITINEKDLKRIVKENLAEILKNRDDLLEIVEDIAFGKLIEDGDKGNYVDEKVVLEYLQK
jgi:hypothetical protein